MNNSIYTYRRTLRTFVAAVVASSLASIAAAEQAEEPAGVMLSTEVLIGQPVQNDLGHASATVQELMIDPENGCIQMVVVALGDDADSTVAVPWDRLVMEADGSLRLDATAEETEQAREAQAPAAEPTQARAPQPPARPRADEDGDSSIEITRTPAQPATADTTAPETPDTQDRGSYVPNDRFSPRFDPSAVDDFQGVIVGSMVAPFEGRGDDVVLIVDVGGNEIRTHLGPHAYVAGSGLALDPDMNVAFTGSAVTVDGETVVLVTELSAGGRTLRLRSPQGVPYW